MTVQLDRDEFVAHLYFLISRMPTQTQFEAARKWNVSPAYLSDVLNGYRSPGQKLLDAVGFEKVTIYREVQP